MNRARLLVSGLLLSLLSGLLGCDVAVVAVLLSRNSSSSKNSSAPPGPDVTFKLWVAELGGITGAAEANTIDTNNGDPDQAKWQVLSSSTTSGEYTMPPPTAGGFDAILIQATVNQIYEVDSIEILDSTGTTIQTGDASTVFSNSEITAIPLKDAQGPPDGIGTPTNATANKRSFIFMKRSTPITTFRVNLWRQNAPRIPGDVEWTQTVTRTGDQKAGGADVNSLGTSYISFRDGSNLLMIRYDSNGNALDQVPGPGKITSLEATVPSVGSASIVIDKVTDNVFVATTRDTGDVTLYMFTGNNKTATWSRDAITNAGVDRVEPNGLTLNSDGDLILAAGADYGGANGVGHYLRKHRGVNGNDMWGFASPSPPPPPLDTTTTPSPTYWYCVATDTDNSGNLRIFTSGDLASLIVVGSPDTYTSKVLDNATFANPSGGVTEAWNSHSLGSGSAPARGQAIAVDGNHNVYVAGFCTGTGLDSFIVTYDGSAAPTPAATSFFSLKRTGNDEFLDIAVEPDGTVYATGYETNGTQGEDLVLYKIGANKAIIWKRTMDKANLADRGVKVMTTPTHVIVVGQIGIAAGDLDIHVRKYVK